MTHSRNLHAILRRGPGCAFRGNLFLNRRVGELLERLIAADVLDWIHGDPEQVRGKNELAGDSFAPPPTNRCRQSSYREGFEQILNLKTLSRLNYKDLRGHHLRLSSQFAAHKNRLGGEIHAGWIDSHIPQSS